MAMNGKFNLSYDAIRGEDVRVAQVIGVKSQVAEEGGIALIAHDAADGGDQVAADHLLGVPLQHLDCALAQQDVAWTGSVGCTRLRPARAVDGLLGGVHASKFLH